jgi:hypothetical protein
MALLDLEIQMTIIEANEMNDEIAIEIEMEAETVTGTVNVEIAAETARDVMQMGIGT